MLWGYASCPFAQGSCHLPAGKAAQPPLAAARSSGQLATVNRLTMNPNTFILSNSRESPAVARFCYSCSSLVGLPCFRFALRVAASAVHTCDQQQSEAGTLLVSAAARRAFRRNETALGQRSLAPSSILHVFLRHIRMEVRRDGA
jgi:hypothetical protein